MFIEPDILDSDDGLLHDLRHLVQRHLDAVLEVEGRDRRPVGREDPGDLRRRSDVELGREAFELVRTSTGEKPEPAHYRKHNAREGQAANPPDAYQKSETGQG